MYKFKFEPRTSDYVDYSANHPEATAASRELGPLGMLVLPELWPYLRHLRDCYEAGLPEISLCLSGLLVEYVVRLMAERLHGESRMGKALGPGKVKKIVELETLINRMCSENTIDRDEKNLLKELKRDGRDVVAHFMFNVDREELSRRFLSVHEKLMKFLSRRFFTGGTTQSHPSYFLLVRGLYVLRPEFEQDAFVRAFWLSRCTTLTNAERDRVEAALPSESVATN